MGLADFCMSPITNAEKIIPSTASNISDYYLTCSGTNSLDIYFTDLQSAVTYLSSEVTASSCSNSSYLAAALTTLANMNTTITNSEALLTCSTIQNDLITLLETTICTKVFKGVYFIWLGQYLSGSFLLFGTLVMTFLYEYFRSPYSDYDEYDDELAEDPLLADENIQNIRSDHQQPKEENPIFSHEQNNYLTVKNIV
jgi:hypothetical protein